MMMIIIFTVINYVTYHEDMGDSGGKPARILKLLYYDVNGHHRDLLGSARGQRDPVTRMRGWVATEPAWTLEERIEFRFLGRPGGNPVSILRYPG